MPVNLIIPDVHNKYGKVEKIIERYKPFHTYILGDEFDDFGDNVNVTLEVATWLKWSLHQKNRTHILGNHTFHYWLPHLQACSGFTMEKYLAIRSVMTDADFRKIKTHAWIGNNWLLSHAGYPREFWHPIYGLTKEVTEKWDVEAKEDLRIGKLPKLFWCGQDRNGSNLYSGILWKDWNYFEPFEGVNQIVGHTPSIKHRQIGNNWCLDTHLNCVGLLSDNKLTVEYV